MNNRYAFIDMDSIPYKIAYVAEKENWGLPQTLDTVKTSINEIFSNTLATHYIGFLGGKNNFRKKVCTRDVYKDGRKLEKPKFFKDIVEFIKKEYHTFYVNGAEADDAVAVYQTKYGEDGIICSDDKDLLQVPGYHYNLRKKEITFIEPGEGWYRLYHQLLTGDFTDNIKGIEGIGPAKASKILKGISPEDYPNECFKQYISKYGEKGIEYCKETFKLIYMMREFKGIELPKPVKIN